MGAWSFTLMRPSALLCTSLVLLIFLFPDICIAGKKGTPPVKHLFGVGIGYQKVVHYKPVLLISKSRRVKHRPPGWGWSGGGSGRGSGGHKAYSPVVIQEHIHKPGKSGNAYGHGHGHAPSHHHRRKRKRPFHRLRAHIHGSRGRGWGWRQGWRRPHRSYRKGYGGGHQNHNSHHHSSGIEGGYDYPHHDSHSHHHHEISEHPSSVHQGDYGGNVWGGAAVGGGGSIVYPSHSSNYYGSPFSSMDDIEDDNGGYESEIREQWKTGVSTPATTISSITTTPAEPTPPLYPFSDESKNDGSVTNVQRDFLKTHMNNFRQFQDYQQATTNKPNNNQQQDNQFTPFQGPPGSHFSSSGTTEKDSTNYDDEYPDEMRGDGGADSYDDDYNGSSNNEIRKMMTLQSETAQSFGSTVQPTVDNSPMTSRNNFQQIITAMPKNDKTFKPSPRVEDMGSGNSFNSPGFFPTFEQFKQIKMT